VGNAVFKFQHKVRMGNEVICYSINKGEHVDFMEYFPPGRERDSSKASGRYCCVQESKGVWEGVRYSQGGRSRLQSKERGKVHKFLQV
jgi:hypothetical protein